MSGAYIQDLEAKWNQVIRPTLLDSNGSAYFISTPRGKDYFNSLYNRGLEENPNWQSWHFSTLDNPYLSKEELAEIKSETPEAVWLQEYIAVPMSLDNNNPFGSDSIDSCIEELSEEEPVIYGIDIAKYSDFTVIVGLDSNRKLCYFERFKGSWILVKDSIKRLNEGVPLVVDGTGVRRRFN